MFSTTCCCLPVWTACTRPGSGVEWVRLCMGMRQRTKQGDVAGRKPGSVAQWASACASVLVGLCINWQRSVATTGTKPFDMGRLAWSIIQSSVQECLCVCVCVYVNTRRGSFQLRRGQRMPWQKIWLSTPVESINPSLRKRRRFREADAFVDHCVWNCVLVSFFVTMEHIKVFPTAAPSV